MIYGPQIVVMQDSASSCHLPHSFLPVPDRVENKNVADNLHFQTCHLSIFGPVNKYEEVLVYSCTRSCIEHASYTAVYEHDLWMLFVLMAFACTYMQY